MATYRDGQTATDPKTGETLVYKADSDTWVAAPRAPGAPAPARRLSSKEQDELKTLRENTQSTFKVEREAQAAVDASQRLGTGPWKGTLLDMAIPTGQGIMDTIGGALLGGPARMLGAIDDQDIEDYQTVTRARNKGVLAEQQTQRGTQTEADAARMALAGIGITNAPTSNQKVVKDATYWRKRASAREAFLTKWANAYGLNGVNEKGQSGNQVFDKIWSDVEREAGASSPTKKPGSGVTVRLIKRGGK